MTRKQTRFTIEALSECVGYSRQAYYQGCKRAKKKENQRQVLLEWIRAARCKHPRLGGRKLYRRLKPRMKEAGIKKGRDKFFDLLRGEELLVRPRKRRGPHTTNGAATKWKNHLSAADVEAPHEAVVADITYVATLGGFCYLALVSDYYSRKIIGWDMADSLELEGAKRALEQAFGQCPATASPIHHSDRGSQYRSRAYTEALQESQWTISMTEEDHCAENAQAERINGILKDEYLLDQVFTDLEQAKQAATQAIALYNSDRPHLSLNYQTPDQVHRAA